MYIYRYPARCLEKGCQFIGTLQDVEKRYINVYVFCEKSIQFNFKIYSTQLLEVEKKGVNL